MFTKKSKQPTKKIGVLEEKIIPQKTIFEVWLNDSTCVRNVEELDTNHSICFYSTKQFLAANSPYWAYIQVNEIDDLIAGLVAIKEFLNKKGVKTNNV